MKKIISVFQRDYEGDRLIRDELVPGAEWVLNGEGVATIKMDGACTMVHDGVLYKRYDAKLGKIPPDGFVPAQDPDPLTGHYPGWLMVGQGSEDKWFRAAWANSNSVVPLADGTYEAIGPHFQGNAECVEFDRLVRHGSSTVACTDRTYEGIRRFLKTLNIEGLVFHHPDGRMAKVKKKDYGLHRKP